jgi:hypothetical protein
VALPIAPDSSNGKPRRAIERERMLGLWVFLTGELENAEAGIRQRLLLSKWRPSDLKLNTGPPRPDGGKLKFIGTSSTPFSGRAHDGTDIVDL